MSTVVLSLFGDEIIPEQVNAVGKSRATRKPKPELAKKEAAPEAVENESAQDEIELASPGLQQPQETPASYETAAVQKVVVPTPEEILDKPAPVEVVQEVEEVITPSPQSTQDVVPQAVEKQVTPEISTPVQQPKPALSAKAIEKTDIVEKRPNPAVKKAKPALKKTAVKAVKKETEKKEKPDSRPILEGWAPDKQYYSIGEVASLFYVATSHIRFWTNEFALKVRTTRKGDRLYSPEQINELRTIYHLVKEKGYTIAGAKARLKDAKKTPVHTLDLKQSLLQLRNRLVDIKNQL